MKKLASLFPNGVEEDHLHVVMKKPGTCVIRLLLVLISYFSYSIPSFTLSFIVSPPFTATAILLPSCMLLPLLSICSCALSDHWISHSSLVGVGI